MLQKNVQNKLKIQIENNNRKQQCETNRAFFVSVLRAMQA